MKCLFYLALFTFITSCSPRMESVCGGGTIGVIGQDVRRFYAVMNTADNQAAFEGKYFDEKRSDGLILGSYRNGKFIINTHDGREMYVYDVMTKEYHAFEQVEIGWLFAPIWSPDESKIVVAHWIGDDRARLMIYDIKTLKGRSITEMKDLKVDSPVAWTEEGIYFIRFDGWKREEYYIFHPESESLDKVDSYLEGNYSPDRNYRIYFDKGSKKFIVTNIGSGQETILTNLPELAEQVTWSPNGKCLAYSVNGPGKMEDIYIYALETGMTTAYKLPYPANSVFMDWTKPR